MMAAAINNSQMHLSQLLADEITLSRDVEIASVQIDSRNVAPGDLFIALPGESVNALSFLPAVVDAGAVALVYQSDLAAGFESVIKEAEASMLCIAVDDVRKVAGNIASTFYGNPADQMNMTGVTGTDGKTSVSRFIAQMLSTTVRCGLIGTVGNGIWGELKEATHTTPDVLSLQHNLADIADKKASHVVMEVSSHGIEQQRIAGVSFNTLVLTNVTRDHLDYHGSVENYRAVKKSLFENVNAKHLVLNLDDSVGEELAVAMKDKAEVWGYSLYSQQRDDINLVTLKQSEPTADGFDVVVQFAEQTLELHIPLLGRFNISNVLAAVCVLLINKVSLEQVVKSVADLQPAPGRMEAYRVPDKPVAVVDFAHTPAALESALIAVSEHDNQNVWIVFGCGGDRDRGKRPMMGEVAEKHADKIVLTDDNPRTENNEVIVSEILAGITDKSRVKVIHDRADAINYALDHASTDDIVLVAGKGHEDYQLVGTEKRPFSDRAVVQQLLRGMSV